MPTRIAFICPVQCDPREQRRGATLQPFFDQAVAICYQRGFYPENTWAEAIEVVLLPKAIDGAHMRRLLGFPIAFAQAKSAVQGFAGAQVIYAFGLESGIIANLVRRPGDMVIWEIADLPTVAMKQPIKATLARKAEKWVLGKCDWLVMTSQAMFDIYYGKIAPSTRQKLLLVENRLPDTYKHFAGRTKTGASKPLRLGWSGFLRNEHLYKRLLEAVAADGGRRVCLEIWGGGPGAAMAGEYAEKYPNVAFHGTYKETPEKLRHIHRRTDLHVVLDDGSNLNVRAALPNRLFYCLAYETPLIVTAGTAKELRVTELGVGMGVDEKNVDWSDLFEHLADGVLVNRWLANLRSVPDEMRYLDSRELISAIEEWKDALLKETGDLTGHGPGG